MSGMLMHFWLLVMFSWLALHAWLGGASRRRLSRSDRKLAEGAAEREYLESCRALRPEDRAFLEACGWVAPAQMRPPVGPGPVSRALGGVTAAEALRNLEVSMGLLTANERRTQLQHPVFGPAEGRS